MGFRVICRGLLFLLLSIQACVVKQADPGEPDKQFWESHTAFKTNYIPLNLSFTADFESTPLSIGEINIAEAPGITWRIKNPGTIWARNDSGIKINSFF